METSPGKIHAEEACEAIYPRWVVEFMHIQVPAHTSYADIYLRMTPARRYHCELYSGVSESILDAVRDRLRVVISC